MSDQTYYISPQEVKRFRETIIEWKQSRHVTYAETLQVATDHIEELQAEVGRLQKLVEDMDKEALTIGAMIADTEYRDHITKLEAKLARVEEVSDE